MLCDDRPARGKQRVQILQPMKEPEQSIEGGNLRLVVTFTIT